MAAGGLTRLILLSWLVVVTIGSWMSKSNSSLAARTANATLAIQASNDRHEAAGKLAASDPGVLSLAEQRRICRGKLCDRLIGAYEKVPTIPARDVFEWVLKAAAGLVILTVAAGARVRYTRSADALETLTVEKDVDPGSEAVYRKQPLGTAFNVKVFDPSKFSGQFSVLPMVGDSVPTKYGQGVVIATQGRMYTVQLSFGTAFIHERHVPRVWI